VEGVKTCLLGGKDIDPMIFLPYKQYKPVGGLKNFFEIQELPQISMIHDEVLECNRLNLIIDDLKRENQNLKSLYNDVKCESKLKDKVNYLASLVELQKGKCERIVLEKRLVDVRLNNGLGRANNVNVEAEMNELSFEKNRLRINQQNNKTDSSRPNNIQQTKQKSIESAVHDFFDNRFVRFFAAIDLFLLALILNIIFA
jgi:hypothetical protein